MTIQYFALLLFYTSKTVLFLALDSSCPQSVSCRNTHWGCLKGIIMEHYEHVQFDPTPIFFSPCGATKHGTQSSYWCYTCLQGEDCSTPLMGSLVPCFSHIVFLCISGDGRPVGCTGRRWGLRGAEWPWRVSVDKLWNSFQWEWKPEIGRGCTPSLKSYF